jgi:hypothetical protein
VVALGVWVITQVIRSSEAKKQQERRANQPKPRSSSSDIDRFLDEINRRRQQQQQTEREQREAPVVQPVSMPPPPPPPPRPRPQPVQAPRPRPTAVKPPPVRRRPAPVLVEPVRSESILVAEVLPARSLEGVDAGFVVPVVAGVARTKPPPQLTLLRDLLSGPQGLRTAVLLNEILGPPKSKRR